MELVLSVDAVVPVVSVPDEVDELLLSPVTVSFETAFSPPPPHAITDVKSNVNRTRRAECAPQALSVWHDVSPIDLQIIG